MEIIAINPARRKTTKRRSAPKKKGRQIMARKRKRRKASKPKVIHKIRYRKAPKRRRRRRNPSGAATAKMFGVEIGRAALNVFPLLLGALGAKFTAKKFADGGAESDNWTWKNYAWGIGGGFILAAGTRAIFKTKPSAARKVFEGALLLTAYKIFVNEIAVKQDTLNSWFSADADDFDPYADGLGLYGRGGDDYVQGIDGQWRPTDEATAMGADVVPAGPTMGADVVPAGPTMGAMGGMGQDITDQWNRAYGH